MARAGGSGIGRAFSTPAIAAVNSRKAIVARSATSW
jgi:hypothetical protein